MPLLPLINNFTELAISVSISMKALAAKLGTANLTVLRMTVQTNQILCNILE